MGKANFTIVVDGQPIFNRTFERFDLVLTDFSPIWTEVVKDFYEIEKEQFASEGGAGRSGKWKPLTPKYAAWKRKKYGDKKILQRTEALIKSLTSKTNDSIVIVEKDALTLGSNLKQFIHSQRAGKNQRKPIDPSNAQLRRIQKTIQRQLIIEMKKQHVVFK